MNQGLFHNIIYHSGEPYPINIVNTNIIKLKLRMCKRHLLIKDEQQ